MGHEHAEHELHSDDEALAAIEHHHAHMLERVTALAEAIVAAVETGDATTVHAEKTNLVEWCENELIPHAVAEEGPLYGAAGRTDKGHLLVEGMLQDHQTIIGLVEELRAAEGARAAAIGFAVARAFELHLRKENGLLFAYIAASPDLSLADSVRGLEEIVG